MNELPFGRYEVTYFIAEDFYLRQILYARTPEKALALVKKRMAPAHAFNFEIQETTRVPFRG